MGDAARRIIQRARYGRQPEQRAEDEQTRKLTDAMVTDQRSRRPRREIPTLSAESLKPWLAMFSTVCGRPMALERTGKDRRLTVVQNCRACCAAVLAVLPEGIEDDAEWMVEIGALVRHGYQMHRCAPVEVDAAGLDPEQLDELIRATELDMERLGRRFQELQTVIATPRKEPSHGR